MRWRPYQASIFCAILIPFLWCFGSMLFGARVAAYRDTAHFYYPLYAWTSECWSRGEIPLWNPLENIGTPIAAEATSAVFYPGQLLFQSPLPYWLNFNLYLVGHFVLAACGAYLLSRHLLRRQRLELGVSQTLEAAETSALPAWSAALSAAAYVFGGAVLFQYCNIVFLVGAAWLPFALLSASQMLRTRRLGWAATLGACLAMMVLGGDPQMAYHAGILAALMAWLQRSKRRRQKITPSDNSSVNERPRHALTLLAAAALVGILLSAVQIVPALDLARVSQRSDPPLWTSMSDRLLGQPATGSHHEQLYDFSVAPWRSMEFLWPNVSGKLFPVNQRWLSASRGEDRVWTPTLYMGILPLLIALSIWSRGEGRGRNRWLFWIAVATLVASFGWYGLGCVVRETQRFWTGADPTLRIGEPVGGIYWLMVNVLPGYDYFRYPAKLLVITTLAFALLAGLELENALTTRRQQLARMIQVVVLLSVIAALAAALMGVWWTEWFADTTPDELFGPLDSSGAWRSCILACVHTAVVGLGFWWLLRRSRWSTGRMAAAIVMVTTVELAWANGSHIATAPAEQLRAASVLDPVLKNGRPTDSGSPSAPNLRIYRPARRLWVPDSWRETWNQQRCSENVAWDRKTLFPKYHLLDSVGSVRTFNTLSHRDYQAMLRIPYGFDPHPKVLELLGVRYLILPAETNWPGAIRLVSEPSEQRNFAIWESLSPLPRAWIVHDVDWRPRDDVMRLREDVQWCANIIFDGLEPRDFRTTAMLDTAPPSNFTSHTPKTGEACKVVQQRSNRMEVEATLNSPGLVVVSNQFDAGWTLRVTSDDVVERREIIRTNGVMQGVFLPAGTHRLVFRYVPRGFYTSLAISLTAWLLCMAWGARRCLVAKVA